MANREKKPPLGKRNSPVPPLGRDDQLPNAPQKPENPKLAASAIAKKLSKTAAKKAIKKTLAIQMKAKAPPKLNKKLTRAIITTVKPGLEKKKALLKNGVRMKRVKKATVVAEETEVAELAADEEATPEVKKIKKRPAKKIANESLPTANLSSIDETIESIVKQAASSDDLEPAKKPRVIKNVKQPVLTDNPRESIEDVMNDLSCLISNNPVKKETPELMQKPKKYSKKQLDLFKKRLVKKENLENTLISKEELKDSNVIDLLDLNVQKFKPSKPLSNRRHSIEKFPVGSLDNVDVPTIAQLKLFSNLPRSISPRSKRSTIRKSIDGLMRKTSPYATRSDSPARILRNGKHRRLKDLNLLDGVDLGQKKRKRIGSDYSDLASVSAENIDQKEAEVRTDLLKREDETSVLPEEPQVVVKRSFSTEGENPEVIGKERRDSNSNLFNEAKPPNFPPMFVENKEGVNDGCFENLATSPSLKVPDKSIILNIMKQTFNDIVNEEQERERRATRSSLKKNTEEIPTTGVSLVNITVSHDVPTTSAACQKLLDQNGVLELPVPEELKLELPPAVDAAPVEPTEEICDATIFEQSQIPEKQTEENENTNELQDVEMKPVIEETPESLMQKESILQALGLQSLKAAEEAKLKEKEKSVLKIDGGYTGTLKTVIKLNRNDKKKGKNSLKMTLHKSRVSKGGSDSDLGKSEEDCGYKILKDKEAAGSSSWKSHGNHSSDTAGAHRKSHYSNRSNMDGSSEHTSDGDSPEIQADGSTKALVIPEKASSFSIHPGRLCKDECSYCFGKFGLFDTPCHIAQMKSVERQDRILAAEKHLTRDSCLCDACYRHVDRKSNTPSYNNKSSYKRSNLVGPVPRQNHCHVLGCGKVASNVLRRKWIIKMRKSICQEINIDLANHGLHSIPICTEHYAKLEHLMVCGVCKRRLASNHMHNLGPESKDLNDALNAMGIPVALPDRTVVCKFCRYFATLVLRDPSERPENTFNFYKGYKKRLLHFHKVELMDEAEAEEPIPVPTKEKLPEKEHPGRKKRKNKCHSDSEQPPILEPQVQVSKSRRNKSESNGKSRSESPSDYMVDYNTLIPNIALECGSDVEVAKKGDNSQPLVLKKLTKPESVREAVEISKNLRRVPRKQSDLAVQRLGSNPALSVRQLFPGEEEMGLQAQIDFSNIKERTPEGWEKCTTTIQYDMETKNLWHDLQKPYGNQSSFLRHLILLEKYFRNGDLVLSPNANPNSINYSESVRNRLKAFDGVAAVGPAGPQRSTSGIITSKEIPQNYILNAANIPKNTPITISQLNSASFVTNGVSKAPLAKPNPGMPPGLISLHPGTNKPVAPPLVKVPQPQKIKFPITKNWRPNLIPIDPKKKPEKKPGLVQVISSGKPYHITIEDYKKMCAIKRSFELKQKKTQEEKKSPATLKSIYPKKGLLVKKPNSPPDVNLSAPLVPTEQPEVEENSLEKLEKLEAKFSDRSMTLPKIPKSLTVIPQTVAKRPSRPSSPVLMITQKSRSATKS